MDPAAAAVLAIGLTGLGAALGQGRAVGAALEASGRQPSALPQLRTMMVLGLGMIESILVLVSVFAIARG